MRECVFVPKVSERFSHAIRRATSRRGQEQKFGCWMCTKEEDGRLGEVDDNACGMTEQKMQKPRDKVDDRLQKKKPNNIA
jgi:hypothetical protein